MHCLAASKMVLNTPCRHRIPATTVLSRASSAYQGGGQGGAAGAGSDGIDISNFRNVDPQQERDGDDDAFNGGILIQDDVQDLNRTSNSNPIIVIYGAPLGPDGLHSSEPTNNIGRF
jgi:hypothetical protein